MPPGTYRYPHLLPVLIYDVLVDSSLIVITFLMHLYPTPQTMYLLADVNSSTKQPLPLKNAGNIEVYLDIKVRTFERVM